jgi:hypothetical protein
MSKLGRFTAFHMPMIRPYGSVVVSSIATIVTDGLLFNLDMKNYVSGTSWPDSSGLGNNFTFYQQPTGSIYGTVFNTGNSSAYWSSPGNNGALAASAIFPANINYSKGAVVWTSSGTLNNIIGSSQETMWGANTAYLQAGNSSANYYAVSSSPTTFLTSQWMYLGLSYNTTSGWKLYMNGTQIGTSATLGSRASASTPQIFSYGGNGNQSTGKIAAALLYTRELSATEHLQNYNYYTTRYTGSTPA